MYTMLFETGNAFLLTGMLLSLIDSHSPCSGELCVFSRISSNLITSKILYNGTSLSYSSVSVTVDGRYSKYFVSNSSGYIRFFAPLSLGNNYITFRYGNSTSTFSFYYFGGLAVMMAIPASIAAFLAIRKISNAHLSNKPVELYLSQQNICKKYVARKRLDDMDLESITEPYVDLAYAHALQKSLVDGSFKIGISNKLDVIKSNNIKILSQVSHCYVTKNGSCYLIILNSREKAELFRLLQSPAKDSSKLLFMHTVGMIKVLE
ncbi:MAG: hypothetical protein ACP5MX_02255 [Candidatus Micrarchaeia archaeon]